MRKIVLAGVSGGVVLLVWGVVAWTLLPLYQPALGKLANEDELIAGLVAQTTQHGIYVIPALPYPPKPAAEERAAAEEAWELKSRRGPVALLIYDPGGRAPNRMLRPMLRGLALYLAAGFFSAWALSRARIDTHWGRVLFVLGLGLVTWLLGPGMQWNWLGFPERYTLATLGDHLGGWAIVGVVQAGIVGPYRPRPPAA
jgi:hypothetical protein